MDKCDHDFQYFTCGLYKCSKCGVLANENYVKGYNSGCRIGRKIKTVFEKVKKFFE